MPHFLLNFLRKIFLLYCINLPNFIVWLPLLCEILGNMCITIVFKPGCDIINFEVNLIFLIKPFFLHDRKVLRTERPFKMKQKAFFIIFKGLSIKQITQFFLDGESQTLKQTFSTYHT